MREFLHQVVTNVRRARPSQHAERFSDRHTPNSLAPADSSLGEHAVRLARLAAAMHMDQAAGLRAAVAESKTRSGNQ